MWKKKSYLHLKWNYLIWTGIFKISLNNSGYQNLLSSCDFSQTIVFLLEVKITCYEINSLEEFSFGTIGTTGC